MEDARQTNLTYRTVIRLHNKRRVYIKHDCLSRSPSAAGQKASVKRRRHGVSSRRRLARLLVAFLL